MRPEYIYLPSFVSSTRDVLETMAFTTCYHQKPTVRKDRLSWGDITGVIPIKSEKLSGTMIISFEEECIVSIASKMLGEDFNKISTEVIDAVDELTNMISGGVKRELNNSGHNFDLAIPSVVIGKSVELSQLSGVGLTLPFATDDGSFVVEAEFKEE